jgi:anti-anti-sigma regulatory factor
MGTHLMCHVDEAFPVAIARLSGRLDRRTAAEVRRDLVRLLADQPEALVVDLGDLVVADDLAVTVFAAVARRVAEWPPTTLLLCSACPQTRFALQSNDGTRRLPLYADRATALRVATERLTPYRLREPLPHTVDAPRLARALVAQACVDWAMPYAAGPAQLILSELVSNAVQHARGEISVIVLLRERQLYLAVADGDTRPPRRRTILAERAQRGRGLLVVESLAATWGNLRTAQGKLVWATLPVCAPAR